LADSEQSINADTVARPADILQPSSTEKTPASETRGIPPRFNGIQVNFCKTPGCENLGVEPSLTPSVRGAGKKSPDGYAIVGNKDSGSSLVCRKCGKSTRLKSNRAIFEELERQRAYLEIPSPVRCPDRSCVNHDFKGGRDEIEKRFLYYGLTSIKSLRFKCRACGRTMSVGSPTRRQRKTHKKYRCLPPFGQSHFIDPDD
jgi:predicted RNA-binding Zn-ribbon protein involved in translation (DUF1610 family)